VAWACSDVTKRHYRGRCTACFKGVFKHRPRSGVGAIMSQGWAWVSRAWGLHGQAGTSASRHGPGMGRHSTRSRASGYAARHRAPHRWHRSGRVAQSTQPQPLALAIGHRKGKASTGHRPARANRAAPHKVKGKRSRHQGTGHQRQQAGKASTCKAPGRTDNRAQAGTAPGQRQAAKPQGTGTGTSRQARHRARASGHASGHRAASGKAGRSQHPAPAAGAGHRAPHRQGQHRAPACKGKPGRTAPGQGQAFTASRHRTPAPAGRRGTGHRQGRPHGWHRSGRVAPGNQHPRRWRGSSGTGPGRAGPGRAWAWAGRQARHKARANRAAQVASIRPVQYSASGESHQAPHGLHGCHPL
jgi:hypothetical protein